MSDNQPAIGIHILGNDYRVTGLEFVFSRAQGFDSGILGVVENLVFGFGVLTCDVR